MENSLGSRPPEGTPKQLVVTYRERFGSLAPENAAACLIMASERVRDFKYAQMQAGVTESSFFYCSEDERRRDLARDLETMRRMRTVIPIVIGATFQEREKIRFGGSETFESMIEEALRSITSEHGDFYEFLRNVIRAPWLPFEGSDHYPKSVGIENLTPEQRSFLENWRSFYTGVPTPLH